MRPRQLRPKKSTTDRSITTALAGLVLNAAGAVWPSRADAWASALFFRTRRPARLRDPQAAGLAAHRFDLHVGGRRLSTWDWGEGPTVLLAHGWNGQAAQLEALVAPLVASGHYVVAFDQPGHGRSQGVSTNASEMADAIVAIGRRVGPVRAVVGHSLGAFAAALALARGLAAERAVLFAPAADPRTFLGLFAGMLRLSPARRRGLAAQAERRLGPLDSFDLRRLAPGLRSQALVLHDPGDREVPFEHGRSIAAAWPGARLRTVPGAGHRRLLSDPGLVREVVEFVAGGGLSPAAGEPAALEPGALALG